MKKLASFVWRIVPAQVLWRLVWMFSPRYNVGVVGIVLNSKGQLLILNHVLRRKYHWGFPSGWIERNETWQQALARELQEETGIPASSLRDIRLLDVDSDHPLRIGIIVSGVTDEEPRKVSSEIYSAKFFDRDALPEGMLPRHVEYLKKFKL